ncbi:Oidioi.mRNA.OKI2018_I69.XSR.g14273.t1.cds [Oikopleura dioica]|uniref:Oidioi.mRNA.OKI2018_I69.XSR.g14273.t1.cds n=1 Tax=Oikopleura dioica TaxID=34765 RepID=A0ABN7S9U8_OIKDI|nr:Oidioi.mRNA.OKI2018_I69.XSR.g14273.t1.cds [Oikopleura dioica]
MKIFTKESLQESKGFTPEQETFARNRLEISLGDISDLSKETGRLFICGFCNLLAEGPLTHLPCGHICCKIEYQADEFGLCPTCYEETESKGNNKKAPRSLSILEMSIYNSLFIKCPSGCGKDQKLNNVKIHQSCCSAIVACPYCSKKIRQVAFFVHKESCQAYRHWLKYFINIKT